MLVALYFISPPLSPFSLVHPFDELVALGTSEPSDEGCIDCDPHTGLASEAPTAACMPTLLVLVASVEPLFTHIFNLIPANSAPCIQVLAPSPPLRLGVFEVESVVVAGEPCSELVASVAGGTAVELAAYICVLAAVVPVAHS